MMQRFLVGCFLVLALMFASGGPGFSPFPDAVYAEGASGD